MSKIISPLIAAAAFWLTVSAGATSGLAGSGGSLSSAVQDHGIDAYLTKTRIEGKFPEDRARYFELAANMVMAYAELAGALESCINQPPDDVQKTLAMYISMSRPPQDVLRQLDAIWDRGYARYARTDCIGPQRVQLIDATVGSSTTEFRRYGCLASWYYENPWTGGAPIVPELISREQHSENCSKF